MILATEIPEPVARALHGMTPHQVGAVMALVMSYIDVCYLAYAAGLAPTDVEDAFINSLRAIA